MKEDGKFFVNGITFRPSTQANVAPAAQANIAFTIYQQHQIDISNGRNVTVAIADGEVGFDQLNELLRLLIPAGRIYIQRVGTKVIVNVKTTIDSKSDDRYCIDMLPPRRYIEAAEAVQTLDGPEAGILDMVNRLKEAAVKAQDPSLIAKRESVPAWKTRKDGDITLTPPEFIAKYYADKIADNTLNQAFVRHVDLSLYWAFHNWKRKEENKGVVLDFDFPPAYQNRAADKFKKAYGEDWQEALAEKQDHDRRRGELSRRLRKIESQSER